MALVFLRGGFSVQAVQAVQAVLENIGYERAGGVEGYGTRAYTHAHCTRIHTRARAHMHAHADARTPTYVHHISLSLPHLPRYMLGYTAGEIGRTEGVTREKRKRHQKKKKTGWKIERSACSARIPTAHATHTEEVAQGLPGLASTALAGRFFLIWKKHPRFSPIV